jgi:type VI secretion system secreted protein VgrG
VQKIFQDNKRTVGIRMQQEAAQGIVIVGESTCRQFTAGHKFTLDRHFNANGEYVLTRVDHRLSLIGTYTGEPPDGEPYVNQFRCVPAGLPYRPPQVTPKARVYGTQVAIVVGPAGEEIFTDKYARVKVQFPWDREGQNDASSSCWCRVGTFWAGNKWGAVHIPRIGQQVIVAFEEGDPDQPIIVGSVYNADQMPPYPLPDNRTQSGIKTRSTLNGDEQTFNELRFEDKKGQEFVYFQAERDFDRVVQRNDTLWVGFDKHPSAPEERLEAADQAATEKSQRVEIFNNQDLFVGSGKGQAPDGSQKLTVWKDRTATLETGNDKLQIKMGNREAQLDMGNDKVAIKMGNQTTKADLGAISFEAMQSITLKVGMSKVVIDQMGVTIEGMMLKIDGKMMTEVKGGLMTDVKGGVMLTAKGAITMIN